MSLFSKLFGGGGKPAKDPEIYKDFRIFPEPQSDAGGFSIAARIEKEIGGQTQIHHLLRADTVQSAEDAEALSIRKAKQLIDEQGERLFG